VRRAAPAGVGALLGGGLPALPLLLLEIASGVAAAAALTALLLPAEFRSLLDGLRRRRAS
jgi:hypothetical protein